MRRLSLLVVLVAFIFSCGGQWAVLQGVAWANMIREYSEMAPFTQAVQMTFSGRYPCAMCKAITERKHSENAKMLSLHKPEKQICPAGLAAKIPALTIAPHTFGPWEQSLQTRSEAPPTPPPRLA